MITIEELQTTDKKVAYVVMRDYLSGELCSCQQSVATLRANASMKIEEAEAQGKEPPAPEFMVPSEGRKCLFIGEVLVWGHGAGIRAVAAYAVGHHDGGVGEPVRHAAVKRCGQRLVMLLHPVAVEFRGILPISLEANEAHVVCQLVLTAGEVL